MKLVVGLGNPGPKYETTRHNVGFLALDRLIERWNAQGPASKNQGLIYQARVPGLAAAGGDGSDQVTLIKPETFMNLSGRCVAPLFNFYKCRPADLVVLYDDLDLMPAHLRVKTGGGAGGHNGIKSLDESLGAENTGYHRVRIGIGHPRTLNLRIAPVDYVLQPFDDHELAQLDTAFDQVAVAVEGILKGNITRIMNDLHRKQPTPAGTSPSGGPTGSAGPGNKS